MYLFLSTTSPHSSVCSFWKPLNSPGHVSVFPLPAPSWKHTLLSWHLISGPETRTEDSSLCKMASLLIYHTDLPYFPDVNDLSSTIIVFIVGRWGGHTYLPNTYIIFPLNWHNFFFFSFIAQSIAHGFNVLAMHFFTR